LLSSPWGTKFVTVVSQRVLFVCPRGAGRSVLAAALWRSVGGQARAAGTRPATAVYPLAALVLQEVGLEPASEPPRKVSRADLEWAELVVAIDCRGELDPAEMPVLEWALPDVDWEDPEAVRRQRSEIARRIAELKSGPMA
jgi:protein-tyrosine-phosphatase